MPRNVLLFKISVVFFLLFLVESVPVIDRRKCLQRKFVEQFICKMDERMIILIFSSTRKLDNSELERMLCAARKRWRHVISKLKRKCERKYLWYTRREIIFAVLLQGWKSISKVGELMMRRDSDYYHFKRFVWVDPHLDPRRGCILLVVMGGQWHVHGRCKRFEELAVNAPAFCLY